MKKHSSATLLGAGLDTKQRFLSAVRHGNTDQVKEYLEQTDAKGIDERDYDGRTVLHVSAARGDDKMVRLREIFPPHRLTMRSNCGCYSICISLLIGCCGGSIVTQAWS